MASYPGASEGWGRFSVAPRFQHIWSLQLLRAIDFIANPRGRRNIDPDMALGSCSDVDFNCSAIICLKDNCTFTKDQLLILDLYISVLLTHSSQFIHASMVSIVSNVLKSHSGVIYSSPGEAFYFFLILYIFHVNFRINLSMCICVYARVRMHTHVCAHGETQEQTRLLLIRCHPPCLLGQNLSLRPRAQHLV